MDGPGDQILAYAVASVSATFSMIVRMARIFGLPSRSGA